jgi:hypothetical protein
VSEDPILLRAEWDALLDLQTKQKTADLEQKLWDRAERETWKARERDRKHLALLEQDPMFAGRDLKVIVKVQILSIFSCMAHSIKAANYVLKPGETYDGIWHMEGLVRGCTIQLLFYSRLT